MKQRRGPSHSHCAAEVKRLLNRFDDLRGSQSRLIEPLKSWAVNDRHASEIVDEILRIGKSPNGVTIREVGERLKARGPRNCPNCGGTGYKSETKNGIDASEPCVCRRPAEKQAGLFGGEGGVS